MYMRKYGIMMLVRHAKHGDGKTRHRQYQRLAVVMWVGMACPISYLRDVAFCS